MNYNVINMISQLQKDPTMTPYDILNNDSIKKELNTLFKNKKSITKSELKNLTRDIKLQNIITLYLYEEGITLINSDSYVTGIGKEDLDTLALYFKDINRIPLLTSEEEKQLFIRLKTAKDFDEYQEIKDRIINANLRLVIKYATLYQNNGLSLQDLIQEGNVGLMVAVDRFDVTLGYKFSTYATQWIIQKISIAIAEKSRIIKYPKHLHELLHKLNKLKIDYYKKNGTFLYMNDDKTKEEFARLLNIKKESLEKILALPTTISLETPINMYNNPKPNELKDYILDESNDSEKEVMDKKEQEDIRELLENKSITKNERIVLIKRYGLYDNEPATLKDVGEELNLSAERIRQIQKSGEVKIKILAEKKGLY